MPTITELMQKAPVIPVLVIDRIEDARPIAEALVAGGLPLLEVTLRTPAALDAIRAMKAVPGAIVGAGTVLNKDGLEHAIDAGADFIVSPGLTKKLGKAAIASGMPFLPGISNAADIMLGLDLGLDRFKFFPAETSGGRKALAAFAAVFRDVRFCPTGGITAETAPGWLSDPHVLCVGGSWLVGSGPIDPAAIEARARDAAGFAR
ncbi:bifunctional 4-hydroxy-2-oxoglutarate aldolase/2-dehydro-3-deoxy-phosphogluconate aldolase [Sphingomonas sp. 1P06PA]|uniref:bifunctional 4-hydroxy-2-oxoglutarate aldolase/2-dehydro-3-deoxy-phosphogluconate aldolase n=1 Tax=Sphingomonas sp. 1P06PA TaxID=554121 RepID=UPI0039A43728